MSKQMPTSWQTVRVFISSTFRDMHSERDWLVKRVFPALRERLEPYRVHLVDIDLRWGVTKEQAEADQALDVCLEQIDECRPFFLGILGERYGWVSGQIPDRVFSKWGWIRHHTHKSITELEILYGVLNNPEMHEFSYFCFRDAGFIDDVPPELRGDLQAEDEAARTKLDELKRQIEIHEPPLPVFKNYPCRYAGLAFNRRLARMELGPGEQQALEPFAADGLIDPQEYEQLDERLREIVHRFGTVRLDRLEEFGNRVRDWLWEGIKRRLNLPDDPKELLATEADPLAEENGYHERFMESRLRVYVGREELQRELEAYADGDETAPCLVTGPSGLGKSAALARFVTRYRESHPGAAVIPHFVGASPMSTSPRQTLRRLCLSLKSAFDFADDVPPDVNGLIETFRNFLQQVPSDRRVVLIVDALNQLDETDNAQRLYWLPWEFPPPVKLIVSCIADPDREEQVLKAFEHRPHRRLEMQPLTDGERREILRRVPSLSAKTLDDVQVRLLLANPATENPLFLLVALEELRGFGSFEQLDHRLAQFPRPHEDEPRWQQWLAAIRSEAQAITDERKRTDQLTRLAAIETTLAAVAPTDDPVTAVFLQVIDRLSDEFDTEAVFQVLPLLASARRGLSQRELLDLLEGEHVGIEDSTTDLFPVLRQLRPYLQPRGELWDFYHRSLYKAVRTRLLPDAETRSTAHTRLADYFHGQDYFLESLEEQRARAKHLPPTPRPANVRKVDELPYHVLEIAKLIGKDNPQAPEWDAVADLMTDWQFLEAKAEAQPEGDQDAAA